MKDKKSLRFFLSIVSFVIFVIGLHFLADIELFIAIGLGGLLLIHELGHVFALQKLGKATDGVYFLPFVGAFTATNEVLGTENEHAYFKYLGPLAGTLGVLAAFLLFFFLNDPRFLSLVLVGAILNLISMIPLTFLDGLGMLRGAIKHVEWAGLLILVTFGFFIFQAYTLTLFLLVIFTLFVDSSTKKASGFQLHEVVLASVFILSMVFLTIAQEELLVWNIFLTAFSIYSFGMYIKVTCFGNRQGQIAEDLPRLLPLTKKEKLSWIVRWSLLTIILLATAFYSEYLLR